MLKGAIGVVHVPVEDSPAISLHVGELDGHCLDRSIKDAGVIDVVPGVEQGTRSIKSLELVLPELARIPIEEVHEGGVARPSLSKQSLILLVTYKDILGISFLPLAGLEGHAVRIDEVIVIGIDVGVDDRDKAPARLTNLILHLLHSICREVGGVESEPTVVSRLDCLFLRPESVLDIEPEDVNREACFRKVLASLCDHVRGHGGPLTELEAECLHWGQGKIASCLR